MATSQTQRSSFIFGTCSTTSAMTRVMIALLLTLCSLPVQGLSYNVAKFMNLYNGIYDNLHQYQADNKTYDYIQMRGVPVTTPAIPGRAVMFYEWSYNGVVLCLFLADVSDDIFGEITVALYNITTDTSQYKPGEYKVEDLSKLTPTNIQRGPPGCEAKFRTAGPGMYVGTWPECTVYIDGKPAQYGVVATCHNAEVVIPPDSKEKQSAKPYNLVLIGDKFEIPGAPKEFVYPCS